MFSRFARPSSISTAVTRSAIFLFCSELRPSTQVICTCGMISLLEETSLVPALQNTHAFYLPLCLPQSPVRHVLELASHAHGDSSPDRGPAGGPPDRGPARRAGNVSEAHPRSRD